MVPLKVFLLAMDVDGTLTDGGIYLSSRGEEFKRFDVKDGYGLVMFQKKGGVAAFISGRESEATALRAKDLGIEHLYNGVWDKLQYLKSLAQSLGIKKDKTAYIGDDLNDIDCIRWAGIGVAVQDAPFPVKEAADWVTVSRGGFGAVREVVDRLFSEGFI